MDLVTALDDAGTEFGRLVDGTRPDQLGDASPCTEFTVRDVINHITGGATMFAAAFEHGAVPDDELARIMSGDLLGDDPSAAFAAARARVQTAVGGPGAPDDSLTFPWGEMTREAAVQLALFDVAVHAWDLAQATGQELRLSDEVARAVLEFAPGLGIDGARGVMFAEEIVVVETAPAWDRVVAFAGRQP